MTAFTQNTQAPAKKLVLFLCSNQKFGNNKKIKKKKKS